MGLARQVPQANIDMCQILVVSKSKLYRCHSVSLLRQVSRFPGQVSVVGGGQIVLHSCMHA